MDDQDMVMDDQRKKGGGKLILIIIILLVILGAAAFGLRMFAPGLIPGWGEKPGAGVDGTAGAGKEKPKTLYPMPAFIVNLMDPSGKRYLKVTLTLELDAPTTEQVVESNMLQIKDAILVLLSSKTYDDINTVEGKRRLKNEIIMRCNTFLQSGQVDNVYFSEFVVQ
jgi:flagellar protein FliL